ncbi:MAG TPA: hybrid sensor histidine kinase/response regulator, partial [Clostridia bacterium]|nr:hybrid sensor histidine kinase/response regulator [Clostridia bacterium]
MSEHPLWQQPEFRAAFQAREQQERLDTGKIASALVLFLMPAGVVLDWFVLEDKNGHDYRLVFLFLRLACSALAGLLWFLHTTAFGRKHYKLLGLPIALLPAFFISAMIWLDRDASNSYYAGLNLVLLAVSVVVRWGLVESLLAVGGVLLMYWVARWSSEYYITSKGSDIFNDFYFLVLTGVIVITGNFFFNRLRFREFSLSYELDKNRKALEESNQKLLELDQIKSRFFANISHELRTPLTLLLAPLETLLHRSNRSVDEETRNLLLTMHANGMRLLKLINDLLDLVRLESGRMEVKHDPLNVADFVKGLASAARQVAEDKRLQLETNTDPAIGTVLSDRDKLEKIVLNLVFNALKFTPSGGRVELRAEKQGDELVLIVADTGMGIAQKNLPHVFDRFWQADGSSKRKYQGVGIGLALVKELVEIQGGSVSVQSQEGKGTTFTVRLPYQKAEVSPTATPEASPPFGSSTALTKGTVSSEEWLTNLYRRAELFPALTPVQQALRPLEVARQGAAPTVLVADDEPDMLRFLRTQLSMQYQVLEAVDGQQA